MSQLRLVATCIVQLPAVHLCSSLFCCILLCCATLRSAHVLNLLWGHVLGLKPIPQCIHKHELEAEESASTATTPNSGNHQLPRCAEYSSLQKLVIIHMPSGNCKPMEPGNNLESMPFRCTRAPNTVRNTMSGTIIGFEEGESSYKPSVLSTPASH